MLTGKEVPGGALLDFSMEEQDIHVVVENHVVANVDVLFHC